MSLQVLHGCLQTKGSTWALQGCIGYRTLLHMSLGKWSKAFVLSSLSGLGFLSVCLWPLTYPLKPKSNLGYVLAIWHPFLDSKPSTLLPTPHLPQRRTRHPMLPNLHPINLKPCALNFTEIFKEPKHSALRPMAPRSRRENGHCSIGPGEADLPGGNFNAWGFYNGCFNRVLGGHHLVSGSEFGFRVWFRVEGLALCVRFRAQGLRSRMRCRVEGLGLEFQKRQVLD